MAAITCNCGHTFPEYLGRYGCPNCEGEAMTTQKRPYAQPNAQRRSIYTDDETWLKLLDLGERATGKGNASAGIREAVRRAEERDDEANR